MRYIEMVVGKDYKTLQNATQKQLLALDITSVQANE